MDSLTVVIPMKNYSIGVVRILKWIQDVLSNHLYVYTLVIDDNSNKEEIKQIYDYVNHNMNSNRVSIVKNGPNKLRSAYKYASEFSNSPVLTCESDINPSLKTLAMMAVVYEDTLVQPKQPPVEAYQRKMHGGSVVRDETISTRPTWKESACISCVYKWNKRSTYPTMQEWFLTGETNPNCFQVIDHKKSGKIGVAEAVPFAFTLWKPESLKEIDDSMPDFLRLDTALGLKLWNQGRYSLRLLNWSVEHVEGGRKSRQ